MASSGKKGKKTKGKTLALTEFLQETPGETPTLPIRKSTLNWADEVEDVIDQYESRPKANVVLPTAPKSSRGFDDYNEKIPHNPPFQAYLSNLPYDVNEDEIADFFVNLRIANMRIPKEGEGQKLKGFGYVEFEDRDSLIGALSITDCTLKNRRIRIELATNADNDRRRGGRMDNNRDRQDRPEVSTGDWRSGPRAEPVDSERNDRSRLGYNRDRDDRDRGSMGGSWRDGSDRSSFRDSDNRNSNRDSDRRFGDRDRDGDKRGFTRRTDRDDFTRGNREEPVSEPRTRTKLVLAPRSVPENQESTAVPSQSAVTATSASIFGNAKPVNTSAREKEIEERLAKQSVKPVVDNSKEIRRDGWGKRSEEDGRHRRSPQRRNSLDRSPNRFDRERRNSLERRGSPIRRRQSPYQRRYSPDNRRHSPENRRRSPENRRRSPDGRRKSPDNRRRSPENRRPSPGPRWRSPDHRSPERKYSSNRKYSPQRKYSSDRSNSPSYSRRRSYSPENQSPSRRKASPSLRRLSNEHRGVSPNRRKSPESIRLSPERRSSPEIRRRSPDNKKSPDRNRASIQRKNADEKDKRSTTKSDNKTSQKNDKEKHRKEDKPTKDNHDRDMPKLKEPEAPNFAASNKYAFLEADLSE